MTIRARLRVLVALVVATLATTLAVGAPAHADLINVANKDILATNSRAQLKHAWVDYYYYYDPSVSHTRLAESSGTRSVTWAAYELLSHGDTKYNYYYVQVQLTSTLDRFTYPYRASKGRLKVTANGKKIKVVARTATKSGSFGETCTDLGSLQLAYAFEGVFSVGVGSATYKWCRGGGSTKLSLSKITRKTTSASATWDISRYEDLRYAEFDFVVKVPTGYKPNFKVELTTSYDYFNSYGALVETYKPMSLDTKTYCKIGTRHCPAV